MLHSGSFSITSHPTGRPRLTPGFQIQGFDLLLRQVQRQAATEAATDDALAEEATLRSGAASAWSAVRDAVVRFYHFYSQDPSSDGMTESDLSDLQLDIGVMEGAVRLHPIVALTAGLVPAADGAAWTTRLDMLERIQDWLGDFRRWLRPERCGYAQHEVQIVLVVGAAYDECYSAVCDLSIRGLDLAPLIAAHERFLSDTTGTVLAALQRNTASTRASLEVGAGEDTADALFADISGAQRQVVRQAEDVAARASDAAAACAAAPS